MRSPQRETLPAPRLPFDAAGAMPRPKKRGHVRATSIAQYQRAEGFGGRRGNVLRWLVSFRGHMDFWPTSGELARWAEGQDYVALRLGSWEAILLYVRRGLSDLAKKGVIETIEYGQRHCQAMGSKCETWRVIPVGRS